METKSDQFLHYANMMLCEIWGISKSKYQKQNLIRRASHDYMINIVELIYKSSGKLIEKLNKKPENSKRKRLNTLKELNLLPEGVYMELLNLIDIRNGLAHADVGEEEIYNNIGNFILCSYFFFEYFSFFEFYLARDEIINNLEIDIHIDPDYLMDKYDSLCTKKNLNIPQKKYKISNEFRMKSTINLHLFFYVSDYPSD